MSNPGSDDLKRVAELTNIIQMDHACNIQFTSGDIFIFIYISTSYMNVRIFINISERL